MQDLLQHGDGYLRELGRLWNLEELPPTCIFLDNGGTQRILVSLCIDSVLINHTKVNQRLHAN